MNCPRKSIPSSPSTAAGYGNSSEMATREALHRGGPYSDGGELHDGDLLTLAIGHHHGESGGIGRDFDPQPLGHVRGHQGM